MKMSCTGAPLVDIVKVEVQSGWELPFVLFLMLSREEEDLPLSWISALIKFAK